eukprot:s1434_g19.t1
MHSITKNSALHRYFCCHFHTFATVKFSRRDRFCTGLHPVSQTQGKECPWQPQGSCWDRGCSVAGRQVFSVSF